MPRLSVDEILELLATGADRPLGFGAAMNQLDHALQTAVLLRAQCPDDEELSVAGLVHDLGHLLPGVGDEAHAPVAAACVRDVLGARVAHLVALHVDAKRYLVATESDYGNVLSHDSVASLHEQGGAMSAGDAALFATHPLAVDAVQLRRADDNAKADGLAVPGLSDWLPLVRRVSETQRHAGEGIGSVTA